MKTKSLLISLIVVFMCCVCAALGGFAYYYTRPAPEVFNIRPYSWVKNEAEAQCQKYGAVVASSEQLKDAFKNGADWCATGWVSDDTSAKYPINTSLVTGCASSATVTSWTPPEGKAGVVCFGVKPPKGTENISPFNQSKWSQFDP